MKDFHIIGVAILIASGLIFTYMELKKNQRLLQDILFNIREKRQNQPNREHLMKPSVPLPISSNNVNIDTLHNDIEKYQHELDEIDELLDISESESYETESELDMEEMTQKVNSTIDNKEFKHNEIIQHLEDTLPVKFSNEEIMVEDIDVQSVEDVYVQSVDDVQSTEEDDVQSVEDADVQSTEEDDVQSVEDADHVQSVEDADVQSAEEDVDVQSAEEDDVQSVEDADVQSAVYDSYVLENKVEQNKQILIDTYYNKYTARVLKNMCNINKLSITGNKKQLIERLMSNNIFNDIETNNINSLTN